MSKLKGIGNRVGFWFSAVILGASLYYLVNTFQWQQLGAFVCSTELLLWPLLGMLLTIPLYWFLRTLRWSLMLRETGFRCPFFDLYMVTSISLSVAQFTPFQAGEMLKMEIMKRSLDLDRGTGYSSFVVERCADLLVVLATAGLALLLWGELEIERRAIIFLFLLIVLAAGLLWLCVRFLAIPRHVSGFLKEITFFLKRSSLVLPVLLLTCASWLVVAAGWHFAFSLLSVSPGFLSVVLLLSLVSVINLSSLIPGAVGVAEAAIAIILIFLHQEPVAAQAGAFLIRSYGFMILLLGLAHYIVYRRLKS